MKKKIGKIFKITMKILGAILALVLVAVIGAVIYFWPFLSSIDWSIVTFDNIKALYVAYTNDAEKLIEKEKEIDEKRAEDIKNYVSVDIRDFTEEELEQIEKGEKTKTEIIAQIISENVSTETTEPVETATESVDAQPNENEKPKEEKPKEEKPDDTKTKQESADAIVAKHIANLYTIQKSFESRVANLIGSAKNWVHAYYKANGGTWHDAKVAAVEHFTSTAKSIETDCYSQVDAEIKALESELKAIGADLSIVKTVKDSAYSEMEIKKAQIVNQATAELSE